MKLFTSITDPDIAHILSAGGIGVVRTDTVYGLVGRADNEVAVARIYELKHRNEAKSPIVLISRLNQLYDAPERAVEKQLHDVWPGKVSVIIPSTKAPLYIRRGNGSVAYRLPANSELVQLINTTGPLVAPSANPEGDEPATDVQQAIAYFNDSVDFYVDGGQVMDNTPSQLLRIMTDGSVERLR